MSRTFSSESPHRPMLESLEPRLLLGAGDLAFEQVIKDGDGGVHGLGAADSVIVSPDGGSVYAAGAGGTVAVFRRGPATGDLTFQQVLKDGVDGVDGLSQASSVTISSDGGSVYAAGWGDDAVAVFSRDPATGDLTFQQVLKEGVDGVDGLSQASSVTVSPDGGSVYAAGWGDDAVAVFSRDPANGLLTFQQVLWDGVDGVDGLGGAYCVTVSPDGGSVYAAGYWSNAVAVFSRDPATGLLTFQQVLQSGVDGVDGLSQASSVTVSPDGGSVYGAGWGDDAVAVFSRDPATGHLTFQQVLKNGVDGVDGLLCVLFVTVSCDGGSVYAAGSGDNAVAVFSRDPATGLLTFQQVLKEGVDGVDGLGGANCVAVSPDGGSVYAAGSGDNDVAVFRRDPATGILQFQQVLKDGEGAVDGLRNACSVTVSPDGGSVYAAGFSDDAVAVFRRNPATGDLTFQQVLKEHVDGVAGLLSVSSVTVSRDGGSVYAAGMWDNAVAVFSRDLANGLLTFQQALWDGLDGVDGLWYVSSVTVSPDGGSVYASGEGDNAVAVFRRDPATGLLTFQQVLKDGVDGVDGLRYACSVTVSPDGGSVYAAGRYDSAVAVFRRNPATGRLTFRQVLKDGVDGVDGLHWVRSVTVSPDGGSVYAAGSSYDGQSDQYAGSLAVFSRDPATGRLTFRQVLKDGVGGVDGLLGANGSGSVTVSPGGGSVYAAGDGDNAVAVFRRDSATGILTFQQVLKDGVDGFDGLGGANCVAVSPDGGSVYTASWGDNAVAVFSREADQPLSLRMAGGTLTWTDGDGTRATASLRGGAADVRIEGFDLMRLDTRGGIKVTGTVRGLSFDLSGTGLGSSLSFTTKGGAIPGAVIETISGTAPVGSLTGPTIDVGAIDMTADGYIGSVEVRDIVGAGISMTGHGPAGGLSIKAGRVADTASVTLAGGLRDLTAAQVDGGLLSASWAGSIRIKGDTKRGLPGDFGADLNLSGRDLWGRSLIALSVAGVITSPDITLAGSAGVITAGLWNGGTLAAASVGTVSVKGDMTAVTMNLSQVPHVLKNALGTLTVCGRMQQSRIIAAGNIGWVTVGTLEGSTIAAGDLVVGTPATHAMLYVLRVMGVPDLGDWVVDSDLSAWRLGLVMLRNVGPSDVQNALDLKSHWLVACREYRGTKLVAWASNLIGPLPGGIVLV